MTGFLSQETLVAFGRLLKKAANTIGVLLFLTAFCGFIVQIFYRYVLNLPLLWTEEVTMIAFIWAVFWAAAFITPIREHVSFDVVYEMVSVKKRRIFSIISMVVLIIAFCMLVPHTLDYLEFLMRKKSAVLRLPMHWIYGCYFLFLCGFIIQAVHRVWKLLGKDWQDNI
ncbi:TRAP transporter small permease [Cohaesibacter celericrescens]|uniref:TRAP transporter small permease protein n=1 Tax=Cohaesibacter celericrescens TaxID=2067669 RepID=A0A2N5XR21_9HYPH|nr:TRAP transporter small permease [Cohaesibacter celericrescens]PLW76900.1 TRAP transporter small permease [Cohaesibacter celericrescens]